jgi:hypothetical protein
VDCGDDRSVDPGFDFPAGTLRERTDSSDLAVGDLVRANALKFDRTGGIDPLRGSFYTTLSNSRSIAVLINTIWLKINCQQY